MSDVHFRRLLVSAVSTVIITCDVNGQNCYNLQQFLWWAPKTHLSAIECIMRISRSRYTKVDDYGTNRKRICDVLLVRHNNFGPILRRSVSEVRGIIGWKKLQIFPVALSHSASPFPTFPLEVRGEVNLKKLESPGWWGYSLSVCLHVSLLLCLFPNL